MGGESDPRTSDLISELDTKLKEEVDSLKVVQGATQEESGRGRPARC